MATALGQLRTEVCVEINDLVASRMFDEELGFGLSVALHIAVIVEVVAAQVCEQYGVECDAIDAPLRQCVR